MGGLTIREGIKVQSLNPHTLYTLDHARSSLGSLRYIPCLIRDMLSLDISIKWVGVCIYGVWSLVTGGSFRAPIYYSPSNGTPKAVHLRKGTPRAS